MGKKRLLVGSIFINDSEQQCRLLDLQLKFLEATTNQFDHIAFVSAGITGDHFLQRTQVAIPDDTSLIFADAHLNGLRSLLELFLTQKENYDNFLFLDSDAFPIKIGWMPQLLSKMNGSMLFDKHGYYLRHYRHPCEIAVVLRSENLETRLHASVLFVKRDALDHLNFDYRQVGVDLLGNQEKDICIPNYQFARRGRVFPLIRSNKSNVHPLACGVYFDAFYHHAAGSRNNLLVRGNHYWDRYYKVHIDHRFTDDLFCDPCSFVSSLAGWNPNRYARFEWMPKSYLSSAITPLESPQSSKSS